MKQRHCIAAATALALCANVEAKPKAKMPNIVWFMAEDLNPTHFALYNGNGKGAKCPNLERLANEGVIFNNAYSNAPVSSAARSTLITGCYAPGMGLSWHRALQKVNLPKENRMIPSYLRDQGYYTSNSTKTDYNCFLDKSAWDEVKGKPDHWRKRQNIDQPFFHVRTVAVCHESCLHFDKKRMNSYKPLHPHESVNRAPQHPDTDLMNYTYTYLYDRIADADKQLGILVSQLKEDGVLDDTFIFFMGDNGGCMPGTKGYTTEGGLQVPLVVFIPENWREDVPFEIGGSSDAIVSFMDLGPTVLNLAQIQTPKSMDGKPFLGEGIGEKEIKNFDEVFCYGDRFDELYACSRVYRKGEFKYSRNFAGHHPRSLYAAYRYKQLAFKHWDELYNAGELNNVQSAFFNPQGVEELYNLSIDPWEENNLANDPNYAETLKKMRSAVENKMIEEVDLALFPESMWTTYYSDLKRFQYDNRSKARRYLEIANYGLQSYDKIEKKLIDALKDKDQLAQMWALNAAMSFPNQKSLQRHIERLEDTLNPLLRSKVAVFQVLSGVSEVNNHVNWALQHTKSEIETLQVLNDIAFIKSKGISIAIDAEQIPHKSKSIDWRISYLTR